MNIKRKRSGYSSKTAKDYVDTDLPLYSLSEELEPQLKFVDGKPTDEINAYKAWFVQKGLEPFQVKFETEIELPDFLTVIEFDNLQAIEINYKVYFKADGIKEVK